ncbi:hypothetical protein AB205_0146540 [Aquarana catesbeiana]|uniref:Uncharacterized protein n=1 Tax=Aquarana catesbeiana TaxID=8400 RepID=A0A2G9RU33_AQUCT|nr:hypothetical protein AB205_0146540 [Aquarana catesbeiana]
MLHSALDGGLRRPVMLHSALDGGLRRPVMLHSALNGGLRRPVMLHSALDGGLRRPVMLHSALDGGLRRPVMLHSALDGEEACNAAQCWMVVSGLRDGLQCTVPWMPLPVVREGLCNAHTVLDGGLRGSLRPAVIVM